MFNIQNAKNTIRPTLQVTKAILQKTNKQTAHCRQTEEMVLYFQVTDIQIYTGVQKGPRMVPATHSEMVRNWKVNG